MVLSKYIPRKVNLKIPFLLIILCPAAFLCACRRSAESEKPPNTLVVALESGPTHLDPRYAMDADSER